MKSNIFYTIIFSLLISITFSQELALNNSAVAKRMSIETAPKAKNEYHSLWGTSAARTVKQGRVESGLFGPLRIGLKNNMELQVHPLLFFVIPNARLKKNWTLNQSNKLQVASEHGFTFPTILLNLLA
ncbi:MAG: hypothetical protein ACI8ZX_001655, partial [Planctomycetota bacterium]